MPHYEGSNERAKKISNASSNESRVTTDAVHRRFVSKPEDIFHCLQCDSTFKTSELYGHYTAPHKTPHCCIYCRKPVFQYKSATNINVFHICCYD